MKIIVKKKWIKKMKKFKCDDCGELDYISFDGYNIWDRDLEGVMFKAFYDKDDNLKVEIETKEDKAYCRKFNKKLMMKDALEYAEQLDIGICPKCGADVDGPDCDGPPPTFYPGHASPMGQPKKRDDNE